MSRKGEVQLVAKGTLKTGTISVRMLESDFFVRHVMYSCMPAVPTLYRIMYTPREAPCRRRHPCPLRPQEDILVTDRTLPQIKQALCLYFRLHIKEKIDPDGAVQYVSAALGEVSSTVDITRDEAM